MAADAVDALRRVPLLAQLSERELRSLAREMRERVFPAGSEVIAEGTHGVGFFVIVDGTASVSVHGHERAKLGPGDHFGEIALIDERSRSASIRADTDLSCYGMTAWDFRPFVQSHPEIAWTLLQTLVSRLRAAEERAEAATGV
jgi:CRP/FNR family cyclic AMP-dependent transcriptional regulator